MAEKYIVKRRCRCVVCDVLFVRTSIDAVRICDDCYPLVLEKLRLHDVG